MALLLGMESEERVDLAIELTGIRSEPLIKALKLIYVSGVSVKNVHQANIVSVSNLNRGIETLNEKDDIVVKIKELDWARFKSNN